MFLLTIKLSREVLADTRFEHFMIDLINENDSSNEKPVELTCLLTNGWSNNYLIIVGRKFEIFCLPSL